MTAKTDGKVLAKAMQEAHDIRAAGETATKAERAATKSQRRRKAANRKSAAKCHRDAAKGDEWAVLIARKVAKNVQPKAVPKAEKSDEQVMAERGVRYAKLDAEGQKAEDAKLVERLAKAAKREKQAKADQVQIKALRALLKKTAPKKA